MSWQPCPEPGSDDARAGEVVEMTIVPHVRDIGSMQVRRALPSAKRRMVGPFIFFDQMGPAEFVAHEGLGVRPHPHINLATVTYLLEGAVRHRDSLGTDVVIRPGAVNWMTAGRGIVHSERSPMGQASGSEDGSDSGKQRLFGLQTWLALPKTHEETSPSFSHTGEELLPVIEDTGSRVKLIVGSAWGSTSPVATFSDTIYADVTLATGARIPIDPVHEERALYTIAGDVEIAGQSFPAGQLLLLRAGHPVTVNNAGAAPARFVLIGGETIDGPRYIWWNFVSSTKERIEQAKLDWKEGRFPTVPGDAEEFIPLPEEPSKDPAGTVKYP